MTGSEVQGSPCLPTLHSSGKPHAIDITHFQHPHAPEPLACPYISGHSRADLLQPWSPMRLADVVLLCFSCSRADAPSRQMVVHHKEAPWTYSQPPALLWGPGRWVLQRQTCDCCPPRSSLRLPGKPDSFSQECELSSVLSFRLLLHPEKQASGIRKGYHWLQAMQYWSTGHLGLHRGTTQGKELRDLVFKLSLQLEAMQITTFLPLPRIMSCFYHFSLRNSQCQSPQSLVDLVQPLSFKSGGRDPMHICTQCMTETLVTRPFCNSLPIPVFLGTWK